MLVLLPAVPYSREALSPCRTAPCIPFIGSGPKHLASHWHFALRTIKFWFMTKDKTKLRTLSMKGKKKYIYKNAFKIELLFFQRSYIYI